MSVVYSCVWLPENAVRYGFVLVVRALVWSLMLHLFSLPAVASLFVLFNGGWMADCVSTPKLGARGTKVLAAVPIEIKGLVPISASFDLDKPRTGGW